ncbi:MAG: glycosyltransferase family 4 protein [Methanotrichaceae archaeon]
MKILQTPVRFYPCIGGVENYVYNISKVLVELGQDVKVICANEPAGSISMQICGIKVKRLPYTGKIANTNVTPGLPIALLKEDFDILHTHLPTPWSADWSAFLAKARGRPLVLTYHNDIVGRGFAGSLAWIYNSAGLPLLLKAASRVIITQRNYMASSSYLKNHKDKLVVVPNGVDTDRFRQIDRNKGKAPDGKTVFFLGLLDRFHRYKGLDILLQAMAAVTRQMPDAKLLVGGNGELLDHYRDIAATLGISKNMEFLGFVPDAMLTECYNRCDAFILPSISSEQEGFGIVLLEAMACERPVISTEIVGVADDVLRFDTGRIVKPGDINALANAIIEILDDDALAAEMGHRGRRLVEEKYTWRKIGRDVLRIYEELI